MAQENCLRSSVQRPTSAGPCPVNEPSLCNLKLTTQQWNLNNFRLPLTIDAILVVTISATGSARLSLDLDFNLCKTRTPFFFATHQDPFGYGFSNCNLTNSL